MIFLLCLPALNLYPTIHVHAHVVIIAKGHMVSNIVHFRIDHGKSLDAVSCAGIGARLAKLDPFVISNSWPVLKSSIT